MGIIKHGWTITQVGSDYAVAGGHPQREVGVTGPKGTPFTAEEIKKHPDRKYFRLRDDDGLIVCYGFMVGPPDSDSDYDPEWLFCPLDDFGAANWGATSVQLREKGPSTESESGVWVTV